MPSSDILHSALNGTNIHVPHRFTYADATERLAAMPVATDVGCLAFQEDNDTLWLLIDDDPATWIQITPGAYTGAAGKFLAVKADESGLEFL
jgi:hypothetical protein